MAGRYTFSQHYLPENDIRIDQIISFLKIFEPTLGSSGFIDDDGNRIYPTVDSITELIEKWKLEFGPPFDLGMHITFMTVPAGDDEISRLDGVSRLSFGTGVHPSRSASMIDSFRLIFGNDATIPTVEMLETAARIGSPIEAYLKEFTNENSFPEKLEEYRKCLFRKPPLIRGFHFLGKILVDRACP
ncbi:MAG TPA: hypothetical protein ENL03_04365 [Phycisphaerae bacterium]|nr:hypothetical protein [Phycisphaerae bacterium]